MSHRITIQDRPIAPGAPTFVIAEIGVNHDGSLARALELVDIAAQCRADAVKLQIFQTDTLLHGSSSFAAYQKQQCDDPGPAAMLRRYELAPKAIACIVDAIREQGMVPLATPSSLPDVAVIASLNLP